MNISRNENQGTDTRNSITKQYNVISAMQWAVMLSGWESSS